jgi:hypothetical protein
MCREFGVVNSKLQTTWKKHNGSRTGRIRKSERSNVDEALLRWLQQESRDTVPVSGLFPMVHLFFFPNFNLKLKLICC